MFRFLKGRFGFYLFLAVIALVMRGLSAPVSHMEASTAAPDPSTQQKPPIVKSQLFEFAMTAKSATVAAMNARAVYLYSEAQKQSDPIAWLDQYFRKVAGDVAALKQQYGAPTGSAEQFTQVTNRSAELAAVALALDWAKTGNPDLSKVAVPLDPILASYGTLNH